MDNPMVNYSKIIADTASNHFNVRDEYKNNTYEENIEISATCRRKFSVGCINITGELNIGMMIRSACLFGAENFYIFGRKKFDKRSTVGAEKYINIVQYVFDDPIHADTDILNQLKLLSHDIICVKLVARNLGRILGTIVRRTHLSFIPCLSLGRKAMAYHKLFLIPSVAKLVFHKRVCFVRSTYQQQ